PVVSGMWVWEGLTPEELAEKPEVDAALKQSRLRPDQEQERRSMEFHSIHLYRVKAVLGINRVNANQMLDTQMSCSSCHKSGFSGANIDREFPRLTCPRCHETHSTDNAGGSLLASGRLNCPSCHVQH